MKINAKNYPKTIVYRKWMVGVAGLVMALVVLLFVYNVSHQRAQKKGRNEVTENVHQSTTLASPQDMDWINRRTIDRKASIDSMSAPFSIATLDADRTLSLPENDEKSRSASSTQSTTTTTDPMDNETQIDTYQKQQEEKLKAMRAPISANQLTAPVNDKDHSTFNTATTQNAQSQSMTPLGTSDNPNGQVSKEAFVDKAKNEDEGVYLDKSVINPKSSYELQVGTIIPGILITGINSDLPGQIVGQVRQNVYDSITGNHILVPQGAKVVGLYDSKVTYGQERVLVVWKRIIYPNGDSLDLSGMPGVDLSGYAGFEDQVNNHFGKVFGSVLLLSVMGAGAQLSQPNNNHAYDNDNYPTISQTMAQSLGTNLSDFGTQLANKNLNIQPTLMIRPGYLFNISVTKDIVFPGPYDEAH